MGEPQKCKEANWRRNLPRTGEEGEEHCSRDRKSSKCICHTITLGYDDEEGSSFSTSDGDGGSSSDNNDDASQMLNQGNFSRCNRQTLGDW